MARAFGSAAANIRMTNMLPGGSVDSLPEKGNRPEWIHMERYGSAREVRM